MRGTGTNNRAGHSRYDAEDLSGRITEFEWIVYAVCVAVQGLGGVGIGLDEAGKLGVPVTWFDSFDGVYPERSRMASRQDRSPHAARDRLHSGLRSSTGPYLRRGFGLAVRPLGE